MGHQMPKPSGCGQGLLAQSFFAQKRPKKKPHAGCTRLRGVGHIAKQVEKKFRKCPKMSEISPKMSEIWRQNFFCPTKNISNAKFETLFEMYLQHFQVKISFWALLRHFSVHSHSRTGILEKKMHKVGKKKSAQIANPSKNPPAQIQWEVDFSHF